MRRAAPTSPVLTPLYDAWMADLLPAPVQPETKATCHDCAMCVPPGARPDPQGLYFDPGAKCCTYVPILWNFLTGALLADESPEAEAGRASVERRIEAGIAVTPMGLARPPIYQAMYQHVGEAFGRTRSMVCPHFIEEGGRCGVWRHRESTCVTWFCKHERGALGKTFWSQLHQLLRVAEEGLAIWCALELELGPAALPWLLAGVQDQRPVSGADFDGIPDAAAHRRMWGPWAGREREFYRAAADLVRPLSWTKVAALGGARLALQAELVQEAHRAVSSAEVPERLITKPIHVTPVDGRTCQVTSYSPLDPLQVPLELTSILHCFDGRPVAEVRKAIAAERGLDLTPSLIRRLVDFGVLGVPESLPLE